MMTVKKLYIVLTATDTANKLYSSHYFNVTISEESLSFAQSIFRDMLMSNKIMREKTN